MFFGTIDREGSLASISLANEDGAHVIGVQQSPDLPDNLVLKVRVGQTQTKAYGTNPENIWYMPLGPKSKDGNDGQGRAITKRPSLPNEQTNKERTFLDRRQFIRDVIKANRAKNKSKTLATVHTTGQWTPKKTTTRKPSKKEDESKKQNKPKIIGNDGKTLQRASRAKTATSTQLTTKKVMVTMTHEGDMIKLNNEGRDKYEGKKHMRGNENRPKKVPKPDVSQNFSFPQPSLREEKSDTEEENQAQKNVILEEVLEHAKDLIEGKRVDCFVTDFMATTDNSGPAVHAETNDTETRVIETDRDKMITDVARDKDEEPIAEVAPPVDREWPRNEQPIMSAIKAQAVSEQWRELGAKR